MALTTGSDLFFSFNVFHDRYKIQLLQLAANDDSSSNGLRSLKFLPTARKSPLVNNQHFPACT